MKQMDDFIKWFMKPKIWQGTIVFIVIIIILALDFAYWAGAIDVIFFGSDGDDNVDVVEEIVPEDYDSGVIPDSLQHGRMIYPFSVFVSDPRGEGEGET